MKDEAEAWAGSKHEIPAIDRMMDVLDAVSARSAGTTISDLVVALRVPRTTVYRILNTLQRHEMVRRSTEGSYTLGPRLLALASRVAGDAAGYDLAALALPHLEQLSEHTGEGCKISVLDGERALVLVAVRGKRDYALTVSPGQRLPLHAGAAGKVLLASMPEPARARLLGAKLERYTPKTLADPGRLAAELARVRTRGFASDKGEFSLGIQAFAAPIMEGDGRVVAALSVPFLTGTPLDRRERIRAAVLSAAATISSGLPRPRPARLQPESAPPKKPGASR